VKASEAGVMSAKGVYDLNIFNTTRHGQFNSLTGNDYDTPNNAVKSYTRIDTGLSQRVPTGGSLSIYRTFAHERLLGIAGGKHSVSRNYFTFEFTQSLLKGIGDKEARGAIEKAALAVEDSLESKKLVISQVVLDVARAYWQLALAGESLKIGRETLGMARQSLSRERDRFSQGISQGVDVERATLAVRQREYLVLQYERDREVAVERLALLINSPDYARGTPIVPLSAPSTQVRAVPQAEESHSIALANRHDLKQIVILLKQLQIDHDVNLYKLLPTLDLNMGLTTSNGNDTLRQAENFKDTNDQNSWFGGVTFTFPLQNREARGNRERSSQMIRIANFRLDKTIRGMDTEIRATLHNLVLARDGIPVARQAVDSAAKTLAGEVTRFELGGVNNRDLLAAQDALGQQKINLFTAIVNYNIALAEYNYACATILEQFAIVVDEEEARIL
jgi:outer membrane protein TolC